MPPTCSRPFDEALLSGLLDGSLTHREAQRVLIHLEDCSECRALYEELEELRATTISTRFRLPTEERWPELPVTPVSRFARSLGWVVIVAWLVVVTIFALWSFLTRSSNPFEIFLVLGIPGGLLLLFLSVVLDRLREHRADRYRGVER